MKERCTCGKVPHRDKGAAHAARKRIGNVALDVYQCEHGSWHLGKTRDPLRCAWRIDQVLAEHASALANRLAPQPARSEGEGV